MSLKREYLQSLRFDASLISTLTCLAEYKGKETLFARQSPEILNSLLEVAKVESVESSNRIEGIEVSRERCEALVLKKSNPKNRSEEEVAGYRDALDLIHQLHLDMPLSKNVILQLHSTIYRFTNVKAGVWKPMDNTIIDRLANGSTRLRFKPVPALKTPDAMDELVSLFNEWKTEEQMDPLILVPLFVLDFLCIHPFKDGNGRAARLLTLLLLYQCGYTVGRYISLERVTEEAKSGYYDALLASSEGWHKGRHDALPWLRHFWGTMVAAYKEFELRVGVFKEKLKKSDQVKAAIRRSIRPFSVTEIQEACPNVSIDLIRKLLKNMEKEGVVQLARRGRYAKWVLLKFNDGSN